MTNREAHLLQRGCGGTRVRVRHALEDDGVTQLERRGVVDGVAPAGAGDQAMVVVEVVHRRCARPDLVHAPGEPVGHRDDPEPRVREQPEERQSAAALAGQREERHHQQGAAHEDRLDDDGGNRPERHAEVPEREQLALLLRVGAVEESLAAERLDLLDRAERVLQRLEKLALDLMAAAPGTPRELPRASQEHADQSGEDHARDERRHRRRDQQDGGDPCADQQLGQ